MPNFLVQGIEPERAGRTCERVLSALWRASFDEPRGKVEQTMTKPAPLTYRVRHERIRRIATRPPVPELARTAPTARLERGFFPTVAAVCDVLGEAHALAHMTRDDLRRLVALGELARERLAERD